MPKNYDVNVGLGNVGGMAYYAPIDDDPVLPTFPSDTLGDSFAEIGYISEDGPTLTPFGNVDIIRDWSKTVRRQVMTEKGSVRVSIISTTKDSLTAVFGDRVTEVAANSSHGKLIKVDMSEGPTSDRFAVVLLGKDGDDEYMLAGNNCAVTEVADIAFSPNNAIIWTATIEGDWSFVKDNCQVTTGGNP